MKPFMFKKSTLVLIIVVLLLLLLIIGVALAIALLVTASAEKETSKSPLDVLDPTPFGTVRCKGCTSTTSTSSSTSTTPAPTTTTTAKPNEEHRSEAMPDSTSLFKLALALAAAIFYALLSRQPSKDYWLQPTAKEAPMMALTPQNIADNGKKPPAKRHQKNGTPTNGVNNSGSSVPPAIPSPLPAISSLPISASSPLLPGSAAASSLTFGIESKYATSV